MVYLICTIYIIFFFVNNRVYKKNMNYVNIIITIWALTAILTIINPYNTFEIEKNIYIYIIEFLIIFEVTSVLFYKVKYTQKNNEKLLVNWTLVNICMIFCIVFLFPFTLKGLNIYITKGSFNAIRDAYLNYEICSNKMYLLITLFIVPIGEAIGFYAILKSIERKKVNFSLILFIIFIIEIIFETGGRGRILNYAILLILIMIDNSKNILEIIKKNKKILFVLAILLIIVIIITGQRRLSGESTILYNAYIYLTGGMQLLGVYIKTPTLYMFQDNLLYGQVLFSGILYPIYTIMNFFGMDLTAGYYVVNEVTSLFLPISNNTIINNGGTFIYYALRDFGRIGIFIYTVIISFVLANFNKKKEKYPNILNKSIFYFLLIKSIFLITEFNWAQTSVLMTCVYFRILCINGKEEKNNE